MTNKREAHAQVLKHYEEIDQRLTKAVADAKSDEARAFLVASKIAFTDAYLSVVEKIIEDPTQFEGKSFYVILRDALKEQIKKGMQE